MGETFTATLPSSTLTFTQGFQQLFNVLGCTDPTAFNYNANANQDDGTCIPMLTCNITSPTTTLCAGESVDLSISTSGGASGLPANLQQGLVAYYPFNGNANDASGNGNNGTVNGATLTADRFGNVNSAYSFNQSTISVPHNSGLGFQSSQGFSVSFWFYTETTYFPQHFMGKRPLNSNIFNWQFLSGTNWNTPEYSFASGLDVNSYNGAIANINLDTYQWVHLTGTYLNGTWRLYRNQVLVAENTGIYATNDVVCELLFGNSGNNVGFNGKLDDISIFNHALNQSEIQQLYTAQSYNWTNGAITSTTTVSPTANTTYSCTVTNGAQTCTASIDINVTPQSSWYADADGDGFGNANATQSACTQPLGFVSNTNDCNDNAALAFVGATDICDNNIDEDCSGTDSVCVVLGCVNASACNFNPAANTDDGSCILPQPEICNGLDENCNNLIDEGLTFVNYYNDLDGDGFGAGSPSNLCSNPGAGYSLFSSDCNDNNASLNPGAMDICGNAIDLSNNRNARQSHCLSQYRTIRNGCAKQCDR
jgi:hypothetical protein